MRYLQPTSLSFVELDKCNYKSPPSSSAFRFCKVFRHLEEHFVPKQTLTFQGHSFHAAHLPFVQTGLTTSSLLTKSLLNKQGSEEKAGISLKYVSSPNLGVNNL